MRGGRWAIGLTIGAGIVWLVGLVAVGIWSEDVCLSGDIGSAATGYTQSVRVWPPALVCDYTGAAVDGAVEHSARGLVIVGWTYVVPLLIGAGLLTWGLTASEKPTLTGADRTAGGK